MEDNYVIDYTSDGNVKIADDVIAKIAATSAENIEGVAEVPTGFKSGVEHMLGVKTAVKNVKVNVGEGEAVISMYIIVEYGKNIIEICKKVQDKVQEAVETMTGLKVIEVNVHVTGVSIANVGNTPREEN